MFEVTRDSVQVWLDDVDVFEVGLEQVNGWIESGRLDRFYPRKAGKYIAVMAGSCFGRDDWEFLDEMDGVRVVVSPAFDTLAEAMEEVRFNVECDLFTTIGSMYGYDYEIWHLVDDTLSRIDGSDDDYWYYERFSTMQEVVDYVEVALGSFAPEFDLWAIAREVTEYRNGYYGLIAISDNFYRIVAKHEI